MFTLDRCFAVVARDIVCALAVTAFIVASAAFVCEKVRAKLENLDWNSLTPFADMAYVGPREGGRVLRLVNYLDAGQAA